MKRLQLITLIFGLIGVCGLQADPYMREIINNSGRPVQWAYSWGAPEELSELSPNTTQSLLNIAGAVRDRGINLASNGNIYLNTGDGTGVGFIKKRDQGTVQRATVIFSFGRDAQTQQDFYSVTRNPFYVISASIVVNADGSISLANVESDDPDMQAEAIVPEPVDIALHVWTKGSAGHRSAIARGIREMSLLPTVSIREVKEQLANQLGVNNSEDIIFIRRDGTAAGTQASSDQAIGDTRSFTAVIPSTVILPTDKEEVRRVFN